MKFQQKEIVLVPFPFSNQGGAKVRPAIILSNKSFNKKSEDYILAPITSVIKDAPYSIFINQSNLSEGNLIRPSRIRVDKIFTIHKNLIQMKIGTANNHLFKKVKSGIVGLF